MVLVSCGRERRGEPVASEPEIEPITIAQAERALGDAMLASAVSLLMAFSAEPGALEISSPDGAVKLAWDERADLTTGVGEYTITFVSYTIPADDPFGLNYNGHVLTGTVVLGSTDGASTGITMDLTLSHAQPDEFPVKSVTVELEGYQESNITGATGEIVINGQTMEFQDLTSAFVIGE